MSAVATWFVRSWLSAISCSYYRFARFTRAINVRRPICARSGLSKILATDTDNKHVNRYRSRKIGRDHCQKSQFNRCIDASFLRREIFSELNQGDARGAWRKYDSNERNFLVSCVTLRMLLVLYYVFVGKKKYARHKERWKKTQRASDIRQREIVWHTTHLFLLLVIDIVSHPSIRAILSRHSYASPM